MIQNGTTYGSLTVIEYTGKKRISNISKHDTDHYMCQCQCGNNIEVSEPSLEYKIVRSCGCNKSRKSI